MPAKVPITAMGKASEGMMVAERVRRKRNITATTSTAAINRVICTSATDARMDWLRSYSTVKCAELGKVRTKLGITLLIESTIWMVLEPGCRWMESTMERLPSYQVAARTFW